jgi:hypothetical protein
MARHVLSFILCGLYLVVTIACLAWAFLVSGDPKGQFALMQLPLAPVLAIIEAVGLGYLIQGFGWISAYIVLFPLSFGFLYLIGWIPFKAGSLVVKANGGQKT